MQDVKTQSNKEVLIIWFGNIDQEFKQALHNLIHNKYEGWTEKDKLPFICAMLNQAEAEFNKEDSIFNFLSKDERAELLKDINSLYFTGDKDIYNKYYSKDRAEKLRLEYIALATI